MIPVKICGITRLEDARQAARLGAAALGMIFYPPSPRYVEPAQARRITSELDSIRKVGVFVNETSERINATIADVQLDFVQLSGNESPEACREITVPVIKAFHIGPDFHADDTLAYEVHALLLDTHLTGSYGGTGRTFDWSHIDRVSFRRPFLLSGGLTPENILAGIQTLQPHAVDVNSGIESAPGIKDPDRMQQLFAVLEGTRGSDVTIF
jgi:phosphoribosylanthranilate isomerase